MWAKAILQTKRNLHGMALIFSLNGRYSPYTPILLELVPFEVPFSSVEWGTLDFGAEFSVSGLTTKGVLQAT